jgi:hypothetical protein
MKNGLVEEFQPAEPSRHQVAKVGAKRMSAVGSRICGSPWCRLNRIHGLLRRSLIRCGRFQQVVHVARAPKRCGGRNMSVATVESAILLFAIGDTNLPQVCDVEVLTSQDCALLLISPVPLTQQHVWLKRISPKFDRKFLKCRVNNFGAAGPLYSLTMMGFADWDILTNQLYQNILLHRPPIHPSTRQSAKTSRKTPEQSLMPLLSAIGLVVVYACNLTW